MAELVWFVVGLWIGTAAGVLCMGLAVASRRRGGEAAAPDGELRAAAAALRRAAAMLAEGGPGPELAVRARDLEGRADELEWLAAATPVVAAVGPHLSAGAGPAVPEPRPAGGAAGPVLVVDDDASVRDLVAVALETAGFEVLAAADGPAALELAARRRPSAIVLDLMLPGIDGVGFAEELRRRGLGEGVPIVVLSAAGSARAAAARIGAEACLTKPFRVPELIEEVARIAA